MGYELTTDCEEAAPAEFVTSAVPGRHMGADALNGLLGREDVVPLDTRGDDEYFGAQCAGCARGGYSRCGACRVCGQSG